MILLDVNLLVYVYTDSLPQHTQASAWFDGQMAAGTRMGMPWPTLLGFMRTVTNHRIFSQTRGIAHAWGQIDEWLGVPNVWIPEPGPRHRAILAGLIPDVTGSNLVSDAHLAALAIEHGLTLCSTDGDFARFRGLKWQNPLRV